MYTGVHSVCVVVVLGCECLGFVKVSSPYVARVRTCLVMVCYGSVRAIGLACC